MAQDKHHRLHGVFQLRLVCHPQSKFIRGCAGQSGAVLTLDNVSGLFGKLIPFGIGLAAQTFGLATAMWLLLAGHIVLFIGLPRKTNV